MFFQGKAAFLQTSINSNKPSRFRDVYWQWHSIGLAFQKITRHCIITSSSPYKDSCFEWTLDPEGEPSHLVSWCVRQAVSNLFFVNATKTGTRDSLIFPESNIWICVNWFSKYFCIFHMLSLAWWIVWIPAYIMLLL